jgi:hypothetical protein
MAVRRVTKSSYIVALPPDADRLLADNGVDLVAALREVGVPVRRTPIPRAVPLAEGTKEVLLAIVGVGITASLVASGIAKILDALGRNKKYLVSQKKLVPVLDREGKLVKDAKGKPAMYWTKETRLLEAKQTGQELGKTDIEVRPTMIKFSSTSGK